MIDLIDFTDCPRTVQTYGGANGQKIGVLYEGERYLLKFPAFATINKEMSYTNGCVSEYISCHIYNELGVPAQETLLGYYRISNEKVKEVVACKDFTDPANGIVFQDFASLKNTIIDSEHSGYGTELDDILQTIDEQIAIDSEILSERFWNMFVIDEFIGNPDRHNGNWGFLANMRTSAVELAPVFDCGSSLFPQAGENIINEILKDHRQLNIRVYERPTSALLMNGKRINYAAFNEEHLFDYPGYCRALEKIVQKIDMNVISEIVDSTPGINELQKTFYKEILSARKDILLDHPLKRVRAHEASTL